MTWSGELWFPRCYLPSRKHCCKITQDKSQPRHSASPQAKSLRLRGKNDHTKEKQAGDSWISVKQLQIFKSHRKRSLLEALPSRKIPISKETISMWFWPCVQCTPIGLRSKFISVLNELHKQRDNRRICCDFKQTFRESSFALRHPLELPTLRSC